MEELKAELAGLREGQSALRERMAKNEGSTEAMRGEIHGFIGSIASLNQHFGALQNTLEGIRQQNSVHHAENQGQLSGIKGQVESVKDQMEILDSLGTKEEARAALAATANNIRRRNKFFERWGARLPDMIVVFGLMLLGIGFFAWIKGKLGIPPSFDQ